MHAGAKASPTGLRIPMTGTDGLEKTLEPLLQGVGHTEAYVQVDARAIAFQAAPSKLKHRAILISHCLYIQQLIRSFRRRLRR